MRSADGYGHLINKKGMGIVPGNITFVDNETTVTANKGGIVKQTFYIRQTHSQCYFTTIGGMDNDVNVVGRNVFDLVST